jgi:hypothetical protein
MLTEKDYCDNDTTVALEELGFPIRRIKVKGTEKNVPISLYEAQMFLREEKKIDANAFYDNMDAAWRFYVLEIDSPDLSGTHAYNDTYMSYEEALLEGFKESVKLLKEE